MTSATCGIARYTGATQGSAPTVRRSPRALNRRISGSVITASPIHWGAMMRELVVPTEVFTILQLVDGAAVGALGLAGAGHVQVHLGVAVPDFHVGQRAGAKHAALVVEVFGQQFNDRVTHGFASFRPSSANGRIWGCGH